MDTKDIELVRIAINEVIRGIGVELLDIKVGHSTDEILAFDQRLQKSIENQSAKMSSPVIFGCQELQLCKSLISELLKELDHFEFKTRTGYSEDDFFAVLKKVKVLIDNICYHTPPSTQ